MVTNLLKENIEKEFFKIDLNISYYTIQIFGTIFCVPERYQNLIYIGSGSQGCVCSAIDIILKKKVAIKKIMNPFSNLSDSKRAYRELKLMKSFDQKNVIKLLNAFIPPKTYDEFEDLYLVMEYMEFNLSQVSKKNLDHDQLSFLIYQILCGVKYLHSLDIIHRDLKPANIGISKDCTLKLLDFGLARKFQSNFLMSQEVMTRNYAAPEVLLGINYDEKVDIWSIGCIIGELLLEKILFKGTNHLDQWNKIIELLGSPNDDFINRLEPSIQNFIKNRPKKKNFDLIFSDSAFLPKKINSQTNIMNKHIKDLLSKMLQIDPRKRISIDEALNHPYVKIWHCDLDFNKTSVKPKLVLDKEQLTIEDWKKLIYKELKYQNIKIII